MMKQHKRVFLDFAYAAVILVTAFALNLVLLQWFSIPSVTPMVFVLGVFLIAWRTQGYFWGIASSLVSVMAVNYAFTYPYWAFNLIRPECLASAVVMLMVSIMTSTLTTRVKKQEQLRMESEKEKMRANLLRAVSHDLRTPLTSISGNASNLLSNGETLDTETRNKICTDIFDDAQWLIGLVENLLSITRIEDGRMNLQISPQLMDEMIEEALHHVNRKSCEHTITTQYGDEILLVNVDARLIMQVVVNLVDNAIKYTPVGSVIQISAYRKDHQVVVDVADNGPGIPDRAKAQVFEMFYTGQSRIADSHRSLGLGLPLCRAILTAHGGTLTLRDNIPNGSVFSFALPQSEVNIHE